MTVNIKIRPLGVFRQLIEKDQIAMKLSKATIRDVVQALAESMSLEARRLLIDPELNDPRPNTLILVNGREISALNGLETEVSDGDEVTFIPVAHGG